MLQRISTITSAAVLLAAVGFAGTAVAQTELLDNGDAEDGDLTGWAVEAGAPEAVTNLNFIGVGPLDTYSFDMGPSGSAPVGPGGIATLARRDLDISECNLAINDVDLQGTWALDGWYVNEEGNGDFGTINIEFFNSGAGSVLFTEISNLISPNDDAWVQIPATSGSVPVGAATVDVTISGTEGGGVNFANVGWDDLSLIVDCVAGFAKISGTKELLGRGQSPLYAFGGAVGTLESGDDIGAITVNYRGEPTRVWTQLIHSRIAKM